VIRTLGDRGPDILVLEEVEGAHALQVLNERFLGDLDYHYSFLASPSIPGIKTVFLSRFPLVRTGLLFPASAADEVSRPIVEAEFSLGTRELVVLANHWKSRIPSPKVTEAARREAARTLARRLIALDAREDHPFVVAAGDFNTSLELSRSWSNQALVSGGVTRDDEEGLVVFPGRKAAALSFRPGAVWDPWETVSTPAGSYYYQGDWDRLDHIFVALSALRATDWEFASFRVADYASRPQAYGAQNPNGISDHFPLVLTLVRKGS
jgi:endonuclease/exonuclease/phosphatase family metal-dependent hydrolase